MNPTEPDPINPENQPIEDAMKRDGEFLRDMAEGKTPTEMAFDLELGTAEQRAAEHDALLAEIGEVIEAEAPPADPSASIEAIPQIEIETPQVSVDPAPLPVEQIQQIHDQRLDELEAVAAPEVRRQEIRERVQQRAAERRPPTMQQKQRLMAEHGQLFVAANRTVADSDPPPAVEGGMPPDVAARIAHPGKEKNEELGGVMAGYAEADKARWESLNDLLALMIDFAIQDRLELDELRAQLERGRL